MDINDLRGLSTVLMLCSFLGLCVWAYSSARKKNLMRRHRYRLQTSTPPWLSHRRPTMTSFWSNWIIILTTITIVGITWLLFGNRKKDNAENQTTGHVYDGIEEYDNPFPPGGSLCSP